MGPPAPNPSLTREQPGLLLEVVILGDEVSPNAMEIEAGVGDPIAVTVESDREGELHVHSNPEQYIPFEVGASNGLIVIDTPGKVAVEDHEPGVVVGMVEGR